MTMQEKKELLLFQDLSGRLPYRVFVKNITHGFEGYLLTLSNYQPASAYVLVDTASGDQEFSVIEDLRPYLRPISNMTESEKKEFNTIRSVVESRLINAIGKSGFTLSFTELDDFLNSHYFDYHGLISLGLALPAPEGMYDII